MVKKSKRKCNNYGSGGGIYIGGFIGAFIYYLVSTTGFWNGLLGFFKAIIWPILVVFEVMKFLGM